MAGPADPCAAEQATYNAAAANVVDAYAAAALADANVTVALANYDAASAALTACRAAHQAVDRFISHEEMQATPPASKATIPSTTQEAFLRRVIERLDAIEKRLYGPT